MEAARALVWHQHGEKRQLACGPGIPGRAAQVVVLSIQPDQPTVGLPDQPGPQALPGLSEVLAAPGTIEQMRQTFPRFGSGLPPGGKGLGLRVGTVPARQAGHGREFGIGPRFLTGGQENQRENKRKVHDKAPVFEIRQPTLIDQSSGADLSASCCLGRTSHPGSMTILLPPPSVIG